MAVIVQLPAPTIVIAFSETVATVISELSYVKVPVLFDDGSVIKKAALPAVFTGMEKLDIVGLALAIVNEALVDPAR